MADLKIPTKADWMPPDMAKIIDRARWGVRDYSPTLPELELANMSAKLWLLRIVLGRTNHD